MTRPFRGNPDQLAADATLVSAVSSSVDHRTRRAAQVSARRAARLRLGAARAVPAVQEDVHHPTELVFVVCALHSALSTAGPGRGLHRRRRMGTVRASLQGPRTFAWSQHATSMGLSQIGQPLVGAKAWLHGLACKFLQAPTILAWDWAAASRILLLEADSP
jgi:hypothetical protein